MSKYGKTLEKKRMTIEDRLKSLNINLPIAPDPVGAYVASKIAGKLIFISGQLSIEKNGNLIKGKKKEFDPAKPCDEYSTKTFTGLAAKMKCERAKKN